MALMKNPLSPIEARADLTDRELTKIIGGLLGGLAQMSNPQDPRNAVRWWAETDEAWDLICVQAAAIKNLCTPVDRCE
jgi:hypothetical protein